MPGRLCIRDDFGCVELYTEHIYQSFGCMIVYFHHIICHPRAPFAVYMMFFKTSTGCRKIDFGFCLIQMRFVEMVSVAVNFREIERSFIDVFGKAVDQVNLDYHAFNKVSVDINLAIVAFEEKKLELSQALIAYDEKTDYESLYSEKESLMAILTGLYGQYDELLRKRLKKEDSLDWKISKQFEKAVNRIIGDLPEEKTLLNEIFETNAKANREIFNLLNSENKQAIEESIRSLRAGKLVEVERLQALVVRRNEADTMVNVLREKFQNGRVALMRLRSKTPKPVMGLHLIVKH